jgi:hypothetical protein
VVEQTSWRGDENIDAATQATDLGMDPHPTKDDGGTEMEAFAVVDHAFTDLRGKFPGGGDDQGTRQMAALPSIVGRIGCSGTPFIQQLEHWQRERCRLPCSGLRPSHEVAAFKNRGNGFRLDLAGFCVAFCGYCFEKFGT